MDKVTLATCGKLFTNKANSQMKIELKKKKLKELGLDPKKLMSLDITDELEKIMKKDKSKFKEKW